MFSCSSEPEINSYGDKQVVIPEHSDCLLKKKNTFPQTQ